MAATAPAEKKRDPSHAKTAVTQGSNIPLNWKPTADRPLPAIRCTVIKRDGERCGRWSITGAAVCLVHGGRLPIVREKAKARIEAARLRIIDNAEDAVQVLEDLLKVGTADSIRLKASTEILDRAGIRGGTEITVEEQVTISASDEVTKRLSNLATGARVVHGMRGHTPDIVDAEVIEDTDQLALFDTPEELT